MKENQLPESPKRSEVEKRGRMKIDSYLGRCRDSSFTEEKSLLPQSYKDLLDKVARSTWLSQYRPIGIENPNGSRFKPIYLVRVEELKGTDPLDIKNRVRETFRGEFILASRIIYSVVKRLIKLQDRMESLAYRKTIYTDENNRNYRV